MDEYPVYKFEEQLEKAKKKFKTKHGISYDELMEK